MSTTIILLIATVFAFLTMFLGIDCLENKLRANVDEYKRSGILAVCTCVIAFGLLGFATYVIKCGNLEIVDTEVIAQAENAVAIVKDKKYTTTDDNGKFKTVSLSGLEIYFSDVPDVRIETQKRTLGIFKSGETKVLVIPDSMKSELITAIDDI